MCNDDRFRRDQNSNTARVHEECYDTCLLMTDSEETKPNTARVHEECYDTCLLMTDSEETKILILHVYMKSVTILVF